MDLKMTSHAVGELAGSRRTWWRAAGGREMTSWPPSRKHGVISKSYLLEEQSCHLYPDPTSTPWHIHLS